MEEHLHEWMACPERLDKETLPQLKALVERYPYFQTARLLYLKNLFLLNSPDFETELRKSALYVADLSVLFYYIKGGHYTIPAAKAGVSARTETAGDRTLDLIERFLAGAEESEIPAISTGSVPVEIAVDYSELLLNGYGREAAAAQADETPAMKGQELIDSFLQQAGQETVPDTRKEAEEPEAEEPEAVVPEMPVHEPQAPLPEAEVPVAEAEEAAPETEEEAPLETDTDESFFTETLAKIYIKQQRYDKALEIIKKLNLKYPKKNVYFADQIRFLEKLIINAKSK